MVLTKERKKELELLKKQKNSERSKKYYEKKKLSLKWQPVGRPKVKRFNLSKSEEAVRKRKYRENKNLKAEILTLLFIIPCTVLLSSIQPEAETLDFSTKGG